VKLPKQETIGSGKNRWVIKIRLLPEAEYLEFSNAHCLHCNYRMKTCPECGKAPDHYDRSTEAFWFVQHKTIYINKNQTTWDPWWLYRHELWHAVLDWFTWRYGK